MNARNDHSNDDITGEDARRIRQARGLSQDEFARLAGVSTNTLDRFEKSIGKTMPLQRSAIIRQAIDIRDQLEDARRNGVSPPEAVAGIIRSSGETPSDMFREFAAKMDQRPVNEQWAMAEAFAAALQMLSGIREGASSGPAKD